MKLKTVTLFVLVAHLLTVPATTLAGNHTLEGQSDTDLYLNGDIITMNPAQPSAQALAVRDGKILAVGDRDHVRNAAGKHTRIIDLKGQTLVPGFIDSHGHFGMSAMYMAFENIASPPVGPVNNIADIQKILRDKKTTTPAGEWILGRGYDEAYLAEGRHPTRADLDKVSTEHPIALMHVSMHFITCNSKCLQLAGIDADTQAPPGGVIRRIADSDEPNGVLEEKALYTLLPFLPLHDSEKYLKLIEQAQDYYASFGITTVQDGASIESDLQLFELAAQRDLLKLDLIAYPHYSAMELLNERYRPSQDYQNHWRVGGVKLGLDGSPQGKTAYLTQPYHQPLAHHNDDYLGYPIMAQVEVNTHIDHFFAQGWQTLVHANGDAASQQMIDAVALAQQKHGQGDRRTVMIHAQTVRDDQLDQMKALQIIPSYFASHTFFWGDWHRDSVLGPQRAKRISPLKSTLNRQMPYTLHNDAPVVPPDMLRLVWSAVNRVTRSAEVLGHQQRISVLDALKGVTLNAAYQNFEEQIKGSIEVGKLADLVILSANPLRVDPMQIKDIQVLETLKAGKSIYQQ